MWLCPWCDEQIDVSEWEDVICPKCKEELEWEEECWMEGMVDSDEEYLDCYTSLQRKDG